MLTGAADPVVPDQQIRDFENAMRAAPEVDWSLVDGSGAMRAVTQPDVNAPDRAPSTRSRRTAGPGLPLLALFDEILG